MSVSSFQLLDGRKLLASNPAPSPEGDEHTWRYSSYVNEGSLDSDITVLLAAIVCALLCALSLNWLLRCARCYSRGLGANSPDQATIRLANTGLKKAAMKALPVVVYKFTSKLPPGLATDCPICLAEFEEGEKIRVLPMCNHGFHMECINKWLCSHSSCPMCRHCLNLVNRNKKPGGAAVVQATESNCIATHVVIIETTDSNQAILPRTETLERTPQEASEVTSSSLLPTSSVSHENQSSRDAMNNVG